MPPRSSWKGFLRLSLVSVPVKAYTANNTGSDIRLNQLHQGCNNRIKYKKVCPEHGEVANDQIVSGYEYSKGHYVVIDTDELSKLRLQSDKSVNIHGFLPPEQIDPVYFAGKTYYLVPDGAVGQKPYALLHQALVDDSLCALAEMIISGREHLILVRPVNGLLTMSVVSYKEKVKEADSFKDEVVDSEVTPEELALTKTLIQASTLREFDYAGFRDTHVEKLTQLIQMKVDGEEIVAVPDPEEPKILNLMDALKQSVEQAQAVVEEKGGRKKKMAPSARKKNGTRKKKSG